MPYLSIKVHTRVGNFSGFPTIEKHSLAEVIELRNELQQKMNMMEVLILFPDVHEADILGASEIAIPDTILAKSVFQYTIVE